MNDIKEKKIKKKKKEIKIKNFKKQLNSFLDNLIKVFNTKNKINEKRNDTINNVLVIIGFFVSLGYFFSINFTTQIFSVIFFMISAFTFIFVREKFVHFISFLTSILLTFVVMIFVIYGNIEIFIIAGIVLSVLLIMFSSIRSLKKTKNVIDEIQYLMTGGNITFLITISMIISNFIFIIYDVSDRSANTLLFHNIIMERGIIPMVTIIIFFWGIVSSISRFFVIKRINENSILNILKEYKSRKMNENMTFWSWRRMQSDFFYSILEYTLWAIPLLGFMGTVFGISKASGEIKTIIENPGDKDALSTVLDSMSIAFDTTLLSLNLSIFLALVMLALRIYEKRIIEKIKK